MAARPTGVQGLDRAAAVTRSLLGYGVVSGVLYLSLGLGLALTREGFDLLRHPLSLLTLGDGGWMQRGNLILTGCMVIAVAVGFRRALTGSAAARPAGLLLGVFGAGMVGGGIFAPDPVAGFPPGSDPVTSLTGLLHFAFGGIGFLSLAAAGLVLAGWFGDRARPGWSAVSRTVAVVVLSGTAAGALLSGETAGVAALWIAVLSGWVWLAMASVSVYRTVPHPDGDLRL